jgi:F-type H+-transporting ATPase subunit b
MLIDWFTVAAQVINFLILVWLMKRFLYQPILHAIDEREKRIAAELADADAKKGQAQKERDDFMQKSEDFELQRAALLSLATNEAKAEGQRLLDEARKTSAALSLKQQEALRMEVDNLHEAICRRTEVEVFAIARKALTDLAGTSLEEPMVQLFVRRLHALSEPEKGRLTSSIKTSSGPVMVRTRFDLPPALSASTEAAIKETLGAETCVQFETGPELISGIELTMNGQKVAWSIADYLSTLEKSVDELLKKAKAETKSEPEAKAEPVTKAEPEVEGSEPGPKGL